MPPPSPSDTPSSLTAARGPDPLRGALKPAAGPAATVTGSQRGVVGNQRRLGGGRVAQDRAEQATGITGDTPGGAGPGGY
jgi:hypothetical protein